MVSAQDCVRCEQRPSLLELFAANEFSFDCQTTSLVIGKQDPLLAELLFENGIFGAKVLNDLLWLIDPNGKNDQHQLPRLQNEFRRRLGKAETIIGVKREVKLRGQSCERNSLFAGLGRTTGETLPT
ncbi:hypothetical protein CA13_61800 [Planctomycetes bacterium CA13]|uniref:Uncharacterized protein n=1 Tax=Novipirellula herctigrandis TaxID=2527986 RepID=A0A5C5ZC30_9BACT|nr:hypothetical protein CA13_61800 [Planctomycetes bacterium CA13]